MINLTERLAEAARAYLGSEKGSQQRRLARMELVDVVREYDRSKELDEDRRSVIQQARDMVSAGHFGDPNDVEIDDVPSVSEAEDKTGYWVSAWLWLSEDADMFDWEDDDYIDTSSE